jgi:hypothetical protein
MHSFLFWFTAQTHCSSLRSRDHFLMLAQVEAHSGKTASGGQIAGRGKDIEADSEALRKGNNTHLRTNRGCNPTQDFEYR